MADVNQDSVSPESVSEDEKTQKPEEVTEGTPPTKAGDKTPPNLLLESLQDEREKRRELASRLQTLEDSLNPSSPSDSEDDQLASVRAELADIKKRQQRSEVLESYPQLKEIWSDFEEFRSDSDNKGMNMKTAAKAFLVEKGLLEPIVKRQGLEKPTGGTRVPLSTGMTMEDVANLRVNNYRKYVEMLKKGQIKISQ